MLRLRREALPNIPDDHIVRRAIIRPRMQPADDGVLAVEQVFVFMSSSQNKESLVWAWLQRFEIQTHCWWSRKLGKDCAANRKNVTYGGFLRTVAARYRLQETNYRTLVFPDVEPGDPEWHASLQLEYLGNVSSKDKKVIRARVASQLVENSQPVIKPRGVALIATVVARMLGQCCGLVLRARQ